jgi:hypothetical protein
MKMSVLHLIRSRQWNEVPARTNFSGIKAALSDFSAGHSPSSGLADDRLLRQSHGKLAHVRPPVGEVGYRSLVDDNRPGLYSFFNALTHRCCNLN